MDTVAIKKPTIKLRPNVRPSQPSVTPIPTPALTHADLYRPKKKQISIRLDADVLDWFQRHHKKYQSAINQACRVYMQKQREIDTVS